MNIYKINISIYLDLTFLTTLYQGFKDFLIQILFILLDLHIFLSYFNVNVNSIAFSISNSLFITDTKTDQMIFVYHFYNLNLLQSFITPGSLFIVVNPFIFSTLSIMSSVTEISFISIFPICKGLPWWLSRKQPACQCKSCSFDSWLGRSPGEGNGNPFQYSCLGNPWTEEPSG